MKRYRIIIEFDSRTPQNARYVARWFKTMCDGESYGHSQTENATVSKPVEIPPDEDDTIA